MKKHIHKYVQVNIQKGDYRLWRCALPGCNWFVHQGQELIIIGRLSICWRCEEDFEMTRELMIINNPVCEDCMAILKDHLRPDFDLNFPYVGMFRKPS